MKETKSNNVFFERPQSIRQAVVDGHRELPDIRCNVCKRSVYTIPHIICAVCDNFNLCVPCATEGVETKQHNNSHSYRYLFYLTL